MIGNSRQRSMWRRLAMRCDLIEDLIDGDSGWLEWQTVRALAFRYVFGAIPCKVAAE